MHAQLLADRHFTRDSPLTGMGRACCMSLWRYFSRGETGPGLPSLINAPELRPKKVTAANRQVEQEYTPASYIGRITLNERGMRVNEQKLASMPAKMG